MQNIIITGIIAHNALGTITSCRNEVDKSIRAIFPSDMWPVIGESYEITGEHQKYKNQYGRVIPQITVKIATRVHTSGRLIRPWLESLPGIASVRSKRLLDAFGSDVVKHLSDTSMTRAIGLILEPDRPETGERLATIIQMSYIAHQANENVGIAEGDFLLKLEECGVSDRQAAKMMFRLIGNIDTFSQLIKYPYLAAGLLPWKQADHLGQRLLKSHGGVDKPNQHRSRLSGACDSTCRDLLSNGDTAITRPNFLAALTDKRVNPTNALAIGLEERRILDAGNLLRVPGAAYLEQTLAQRIVTLERSTVKGIEFPQDIELLVRSHENSSRSLSAEQRHAVCDILQSKFHILQGGAGTGKTTTLKVLVDVWVSCGGNVILGALSGKAALRMSRSTGRLAQTLARHLLQLERNMNDTAEYGLELFPGLNSKTMLIIDEASMVDLVTMRKLASAIPEGASIVLVGDMGQLPPVGIGQAYHDLVESGHNVFNLSQVHRQSAGNPIIDAATAVRTGHLPLLPVYQGKSKGVFHLDVPFESIDGSIIKLLDTMLPTVPIEDILAIAALKRTCTSINRCMQVRRQLAGHEGIRIGPSAPWVSIGEPVICTRNRYEHGLMNGMIGHVTSLDPFTVKWDGDATGKQVPLEVYIDICSAWAITCHRAQGSEARYVIVALDKTEFLTREWLYTAITRATDQVILVGPASQIKAAIASRSTRTTYFKHELNYWRSKL